VVLENIPLFSELEKEAVSSLDEKIILRKYKEKHPIVTEGDESTSLYVIVSGKVKIYSSEEDGKEVTLSFHSEGDYFGEIALLDGKPRSATAITTEKSTIAVISKPVFLDFIKDHPEIALKVTAKIVNQIRELTHNYKAMALKSVYGRIKFQLEKQAKSSDKKSAMTEILIHQDIANLVGASREMVTRILNELKSGQFITIHPDKRIQINKKLPDDW